MSKMNEIVESCGEKLQLTNLSYFDYRNLNDDSEFEILDVWTQVPGKFWELTPQRCVYNRVGLTDRDGKVIVCDPERDMSRPPEVVWSVPLVLAAWIYEQEAPQGGLLRRRLRLDRLSAKSWLAVCHGGGYEHFDLNGKYTEETRLMAQQWSRDGSWSKYNG